MSSLCKRLEINISITLAPLILTRKDNQLKNIIKPEEENNKSHTGQELDPCKIDQSKSVICKIISIRIGQSISKSRFGLCYQKRKHKDGKGSRLGLVQGHECFLVTSQIDQIPPSRY